MACRQCGSSLERPGDYCLVCRTPNADAVVVALRDDEATLTFLEDEDVVGETTVPTVPETDADRGTRQVRNFAGRVADEIRRKRPESVFLAGAHDLVRAVRADLHHDVYRVPADDPVAAVLDRRGGRDLEVVETPADEKLGGSHSTIIGGREGRRVLREVAGHPHVKKVVPGPIDGGGSAPRGGVRAKVTRADPNGNLRLLVREGSSIQEDRIVTTARDTETGERIRADLNRVLADAGYREDE